MISTVDDDLVASIRTVPQDFPGGPVGKTPTTDIWLFPDGGGNSNHICVYFTAPIKGRKEK